ncbi:30S ribosomal protein S6 [Candidatus Uhrbacteria bacterium]|nr:30S ribosomal protein S6 [Candidatus Uhrbacteria bacterium]
MVHGFFTARTPKASDNLGGREGWFTAQDKKEVHIKRGLTHPIFIDTMPARMHYYELLLIIPTRFTDAEVLAAEERARALIELQQMKVIVSQNLGKIRLAYPVRGERFGTYVRIAFGSDSSDTTPLERALRLSSDFIRFQLVSTSEKALQKPFRLIAYQEPIPGGDRERDSQPRVPRVSPRPRPAPVAPSLTEEEIDKSIDKILEEKVL